MRIGPKDCQPGTYELPPDNASAPNPSSDVTFTDVSCIIHAGVSIAKLQRMRGTPTNEELPFSIKFIKCENGEPTQLSTGGGIPLYLIAKSLRQTSAGFHIIGEIARQEQTAPMKFGSHLSEYRHLIPTEWFQPGHIIQIIHRGAACHGLVISVTDPDTGNKLRLCTKNL